MAKSKKKAAPARAPAKKSSKPSKKATGSKKAEAPKHRAPRVVPAGLSNDDKQQLLKPGPNYDSVTDDSVIAWKANTRFVRVEGLTVAKFAASAKKAERAWEKEKQFRAKMDAKLTPLMDSRMRLEDAHMQNMLDLNAQVKTSARRRPELLDAFQSLRDFCARGGGSRSSTADGSGDSADTTAADDGADATDETPTTTTTTTTTGTPKTGTPKKK